MSEWTRAGDVDADIKIEPAVGDVWAKKGGRDERAFAWITDIVPFPVRDEKPKPVRRVCILTVKGTEERRDWITVDELRTRFVFRRRG